MENKVITTNYQESTDMESELGNSLGFFAGKHQQAMRGAQELLCKAEVSGANIHDSLNCGKLGRLLAYIKNGSAFAMLWVSYYADYMLA